MITLTVVQGPAGAGKSRLIRYRLLPDHGRTVDPNAEKSIVIRSQFSGIWYWATDLKRLNTDLKQPEFQQATDLHVIYETRDESPWLAPCQRDRALTGMPRPIGRIELITLRSTSEVPEPRFGPTRAELLMEETR